ncbi:hypothetical protein [Paraburkholderia pallida]|uniref:Capsular polysaccharide transport system permease protein n=1 Tax=Paraburkholderia pallida TaxID=2547399 RepID=A0A4P7CT81_9BURK|nr:hypothetical protein [Paraburkholderia pallida]QBQ98337.1 hypothetical protein E1956_14940 [Paraburkholderia pallida]
MYRHFRQVFEASGADTSDIHFVDTNDDACLGSVKALISSDARFVLQINPNRRGVCADIADFLEGQTGASVVKVPMLLCSSLWPYDYFDSALQQSGSSIAGTRGDSKLKALVQSDDVSEEEVFEYIGGGGVNESEVEEAFKSDKEQWNVLQSECGWNFQNYLVENFSVKKLFNSHTLPSNASLELLVKKIENFLELNAVERAESEKLMSHTEILQPETPIHPRIGKVLNLAWLADGRKFDIYGRKTDYPRWVTEYGKFYAPMLEFPRSRFSDRPHGFAEGGEHGGTQRVNHLAPNAPNRDQGVVHALFGRLDTLFVLCVIVPFVVSTLYFGLIASDVYVSQSSFIIRTPSKNNQSNSFVGQLLQSTGISRASDDTYAVNNYLTSRDALASLNAGSRYEAAYSGGKADVFSRFGLFPQQRTFEDLFKYFQDHANVQFDSDTGISTLEVHAFSASEAKDLNEHLLELGEQRINQMNDRVQLDLVTYAQREVVLAESSLKQAATALFQYREKQAVFDPNLQSSLILQNVTKLQNELVTSKIQLAQLKAVSPSNPQIGALDVKIKSLQDQVDAASRNVTDGQSSLAFKSPAYERLELDKQFADKQLAAAVTSLEAARSDAQRQHLYLERISQPNEPDKALLPRRGRTVLAIIAIGFIVWCTLKLLIASIKEHRE